MCFLPKVCEKSMKMKLSGENGLYRKAVYFRNKWGTYLHNVKPFLGAVLKQRDSVSPCGVSLCMRPVMGTVAFSTFAGFWFYLTASLLQIGGSWQTVFLLAVDSQTLLLYTLILGEIFV